MSLAQYYFWLAQQAVSWLVHFKYTAILISTNLLFSLIYSFRKEDKFSFKYFILFVPFLFPIILLLMGVVFKHNTSGSQVVLSWPQYTIGLISFLQIVISVYCIKLMKRFNGLQ